LKVESGIVGVEEPIKKTGEAFSEEELK